MAESEPLVKHNPFKKFIENTNVHTISQEKLLNQLNTSLDGSSRVKDWNIPKLC